MAWLHIDIIEDCLYNLMGLLTKLIITMGTKTFFLKDKKTFFENF